MNNKINISGPVVGETIVGEQSQEQLCSRRRAVGAIAGVSLAVWHKPIIDAVVLPAHAQASMMALSFFGGALVTQKSNSLLDALVPTAYAGEDVGFNVSSAQALLSETSAGSGEFSMELLIDFSDLPLPVLSAQGLYTGMVSSSGASSLTLAEDPCNIEGVNPAIGTIAVEVSSVSEDKAVLLIDGQIIEVPAGSGMLAAPTCSTELADAYTLISGGDVQVGATGTEPSSLLSAIVPEAHAGVVVMYPTGPSIKASVSEATIQLKVQIPGKADFSGELTLFDNSPVSLDIDAQCPGMVFGIVTAKLDGISDNLMNVTIAGDMFGPGQSFIVPAIDIVLPALICTD